MRLSETIEFEKAVLMKKKKMRIIPALFVLALGIVFAACKNTGEKKSLEEYAVLTLDQAKEASESGSFGVGGILMDRDGNVICKMHNRVIEGKRVNDPTAHGERQIVDWYLKNKEKEDLPEPEDCILITSLDPCVMCTGALAQAGFDRVIVLALDDSAGINYKGDEEFSTLDGTKCQKYVKEHFAYPEVKGDHARKAKGADLSDLKIFSDITVSSETIDACWNAVITNLDGVRDTISSVSVDPDDVMDPADLKPDHPIRRYLKDSFGSDFLAFSWKPGDPADGFIDYIDKEHPGFDGVAYFDKFGNLLYLDEDDRNISTQSAFMKVTRKYAAVRNTEPIEGYEINSYLAAPKYGYFVYMTCPKISAKTIMELGAIGSTLESASEHPVMYIYGKENEDALSGVIKRLPPLYADNINISFEQIPTGDQK